MAQVSQMDVEFLRKGREHIRNFLERTAQHLQGVGGRLLEVGSQGRTEVQELFRGFTVETLDIDATYNPTHVGDITKRNDFIPNGSYNCVVCMDVLEHTLDPFGAVQEIGRILAEGGYFLVSAPLNFRIHGPLPDCWRFTEHGLKVLLRNWAILEIDILETPNRDLFPIHYNVLAQKPVPGQQSASPLFFRFID